MNLDTFAIIALELAAIPCGLFMLNLLVYRPLPRSVLHENALDSNVRCAFRNRHFQNNPPAFISCGISVLIPARNEEQNIRSTLEAVFSNRGLEFEVIVLDDHSTDQTAAIVSDFARRDSRVRLESAPALPAGWCGKQHACHVLAKLARHPLLLFIDADVELAPDALARMGHFLQTSGADLASGVPRQQLGTFSERLLIPQIHFILLGFLPMHAMRRTRLASMSAGCGQLFIARRQAYERCGGHAKLRNSLHDGIKLPRVFRQAGLTTDLFDATDLAACRMYHTNAETWRGLGKNATEGLAAPGAIGPMTALLLGGQVLPVVLLALSPRLSSEGFAITLLATTLALLPRLVAARRFKQTLGSALLHPLGVLALLVIQWHALFRYFAGKPSEWKGRSYGRAPVEAIKAT